MRHRRNKRFEEEYTGIPFSGINEEENDELWKDNQKEERIEELSKEELKNKYFENYDNTGNSEDFYEEEKPRRAKHKGKRFK